MKCAREWMGDIARRGWCLTDGENGVGRCVRVPPRRSSLRKWVKLRPVQRFCVRVIDRCRGVLHLSPQSHFFFRVLLLLLLFYLTFASDQLLLEVSQKWLLPLPVVPGIAPSPLVSIDVTRPSESVQVHLLIRLFFGRLLFPCEPQPLSLRSRRSSA